MTALHRIDMDNCISSVRLCPSNNHSVNVQTQIVQCHHRCSKLTFANHATSTDENMRLRHLSPGRSLQLPKTLLHVLTGGQTCRKMCVARNPCVRVD